VKLHASAAAGRNAFTAYGADFVAVNGEPRRTSLVVLPDRVLDWPPASFEALAAAHFEQLAALGVELVLLGTGPRLRFPAPSLTAPLANAGIGLEVMDVQAACRTYNILAAEERVVAAALVLG